MSLTPYKAPRRVADCLCRSNSIQLWDDIREELRSETPDFKFHIWIEPLELAAVHGKTLYVRAPEHIRTSVAERYLPLLRRAAVKRFDRHARSRSSGRAGQRRPSRRRRAGRRRDAPRAERLNPKYSFEQFVIGEGNRFAHAASLAVAELPAQAYNPLFLHGPPGLGKTHLLHAIGNYVQRYGAGCACATRRSRSSRRASSTRSAPTRTGDFKDDFRNADVVLIDDVQFLAGRDKTREEFFHTFNALLDSGAPAGDHLRSQPRGAAGLEDRLRERFRAGLVVELEPPPADLRRAILAKRARLDGVDSPTRSSTRSRCGSTSSVRALEGALIRVVAYASLNGEEPTPALVRHVLRRLGEDTARDACGLSEILDAAAQEFGVSRDALLARDRRPAVATARQVAMYLARELTEHSLPEIGRGIGGRNHTTVLHAVNRDQRGRCTPIAAVRKRWTTSTAALGRRG